MRFPFGKALMQVNPKSLRLCASVVERLYKCGPIWRRRNSWKWTMPSSIGDW